MLALDYEAFVGWALPASPDHWLRGTRLPLGDWAQIVRKAVGLAERHLAAGTLLSWAPLGRCRLLLPLGGRVCAGLSARPFFAARHEVMLQLIRLATHCRDPRMRPPLGDRFLMDYFPCPLEGGAPLLPYARPRGRRPEASPSQLHSAAARRGRAAAHRVRSAWSMGRRLAPVAEAWAGASAAAAGHATTATPAPRRAHAVQESRPGSRRDARYSSLRTDAHGRPHCPLAGAGPPGFPRPPELRPPGGTPVHGTAQDAGYSPLLDIGARRPQAHKAPGA